SYCMRVNFCFNSASAGFSNLSIAELVNGFTAMGSFEAALVSDCAGEQAPSTTAINIDQIPANIFCMPNHTTRFRKLQDPSSNIERSCKHKLTNPLRVSVAVGISLLDVGVVVNFCVIIPASWNQL